MPLLQRLAGFFRRRSKVLLGTLAGLLLALVSTLSLIPECYTAQAVLGSDSAKGYEGQVKMLIARVTSRTLLQRVAKKAKLDAQLSLGEQLAGLPEEPALRLNARARLEGQPGAVERLEITVQGCNPSSATTAAQELAERLVDYDRQLRHRTIAQRARGEDVPEATGKPARVLLEELRQKHPRLRDAGFAERFQREEAELAEEEIALSALRKRHAALAEQARALGEQVRREAESAYAAHRAEQERLASRERNEEAKREAEERRQAAAAKRARQGEAAPSHRLSAFESELRRMLATRTRRHPDVRRLLRKIELLRAEGAEEGRGAAEPEGPEQSRPVSDMPRAVMPIADPDSAPVALAQDLPAHWLQRAPRYGLWVEAQSAAAQAKVTLEGRAQALERREAKHEALAGELTKLNAARLKEQELLAAQREEEALRANANDLPPIHEPLLIVEQARILDSSTPWRFFLPLTLLAGLLSLLAAWVTELQDRSFHEPMDVAHRVDLPVLGVIPHLRRGR